jgi:hypothetical protein
VCQKLPDYLIIARIVGKSDQLSRQYLQSRYRHILGIPFSDCNNPVDFFSMTGCYRAHVAQRIEKNQNSLKKSAPQCCRVIFLLCLRQSKNSHLHKNRSDTHHCSCSQHGRLPTLASRLVSSCWLYKHGHGHKSTSQQPCSRTDGHHQRYCGKGTTKS